MGTGITSNVPGIFKWAAIILPIVVLLLAMIRRSGDAERKLRQNMILMITVQSFLFFSYYLYVLWSYYRSPFGHFLLSPQNGYFFRQFGTALSSLLSGFIAAAVVLLVGWWLIRKQRTVLIDGADLGFIVLGVLAVGWPATLVYLATTFVLSVLGLVTLIIFRRKTIHDRLIITPYILPAAILTLLFRTQLLTLTHLDKIRF